MKSEGLRKKIKYFSIASLGMLFLISGLLYFVVIYRFKESVKYIVHNQTDGKYIFDAGRATVSLWSKSLVLEKSVLICKDANKTNTYYNVKLSKLKFSLTSWNALIFKNKILVDSLEIMDPDVNMYAKPQQRTKSKTVFRPSEILSFLEKIQQSFNLRNLSIKNAAFSLKQGNKKPVNLKNINLSIRNFAKVNNNDNHLLGSDHIKFSIGKQSISFPDRYLTVAFSSLIFDSKNQIFNVDSLMLYQHDINNNERIQFTADRFTFNSKHLPATYQKELLLLDTVRCINPVLTLYDSKNKLKKSSAQNNKVKNAIFKLINIKFLEIANASVLEKKSNGTLKNSPGKTANLTVFNLSLHPNQNPKITLDSVHLNMEKIAFFSKDSLHKLTIEEFSFRNNDIIFRHVNYRPTAKQKSPKSMVFSAPALILKNVNLEALLKKKLIAKQAELIKPLIIIDDRYKVIGKNSKSKPFPNEKKSIGLYLTLHQLRQMINVDQLLVKDAAIQYKGPIKSNIILNAKNLNAKIILNKTLNSDSLVDIKHSIHKLTIGNVNLKSDKFQLNLRNYKFAGLNRQNWAEKLNFYQNKKSVIANTVYWKAFDWDLFQKSKVIKIDSLYINNIMVDLANVHKTNLSHTKKDIPDIRIAKLRVGKLLFNSKSSRNQIGFTGNDISLKDLKSHKDYFIWKDINLNISNFRILGENTYGTIGNIYLHNNIGKVQNILFTSNSEKGLQRIFLPSLVFTGKMNSNKRDSIALRLVLVNAGGIEIHSKPQSNSQSFNTPKIPFHIQLASIKNLKVNYIKEKKKDTVKFNSVLNFEAQNIESLSKGSQIIKYDDMVISLVDSDYGNEKLHLTIPQLSLTLKRGNIFCKDDAITLSSGLSINWFDLAFNFQKDSLRLQASNNSGSYHDTEFLLSLNHKVDVNKIIAKTNLEGGPILYRDGTTKAEIKSYRWNSLKNQFSLTNFNLQPVMSREMFFKTSKYQDNYLEIRGDSVVLSVSKLGKLPSDSTPFSFGSINMDGVHVSISRDKNLPRKPQQQKLMPTQLISSVKVPFSIDTISLNNNSVLYKELETKSNTWSEIPFSALNGTIVNLSNLENRKDSIELNVSGRLFKANIKRFSYRESYVDSLAGFSAIAHFSTIDLKDFSYISRPMALVDITSGDADNLYSSWSGNQYAATGSMKFSYDGLKVKFTDPDGKSKWHLYPKAKTFAANLILPNSRHKSTMMYAERDQNKFIFNYWIKMQLSGLLSTFGLKSDKKYLKIYNKNHQRYGLPEIGNTASE